MNEVGAAMHTAYGNNSQENHNHCRREYITSCLQFGEGGVDIVTIKVVFDNVRHAFSVDHS